MFGGWRRLADFVCEHTGVVEEKNKPEWQSNGGHEVDEGTSITNCQTIKSFD